MSVKVKNILKYSLNGIPLFSAYTTQCYILRPFTAAAANTYQLDCIPLIAQDLIKNVSMDIQLNWFES